MNPLRQMVIKKQAAEQFLQGVGRTTIRPAAKGLYKGVKAVGQAVAHIPAAFTSTPGLKSK